MVSMWLATSEQIKLLDDAIREELRRLYDAGQLFPEHRKAPDDAGASPTVSEDASE